MSFGVIRFASAPMRTASSISWVLASTSCAL